MSTRAGRTGRGTRTRPFRVPALVLAAALGVFALTAAYAGPTTPWTTVFTTASSGQQGLATDGRFVWTTSDVGGGMATITTYTAAGALVGISRPLPLGHAAELDYRTADGRLYVANGGLATERTGASAKVFTVALDAAHVATSVVATTDLGWLGRNALVAVDNRTDTLAVIGGPDGGPWRIATTSFPLGGAVSAATPRSVVRISDPHVVLQGLGVAGGRFLLYVSDQRTGRSRLDVFSTTGARISSQTFSFTGEAEGLAIDPLSGTVELGTRGPGRVLRLTPSPWFVAADALR